MSEKKQPACVTTVRTGNTILVASAFFNESSGETAADKMSRVLELEADKQQKVITLNR